MLEVLMPCAFVAIVVYKIECTDAMLVVLLPFTFISLTVGESVCTIAFAFAFDILAFVYIAILEYGFPRPVGLPSFELSGVNGAVLQRASSYFYFAGKRLFQPAEQLVPLFLRCDVVRAQAKQA